MQYIDAFLSGYLILIDVLLVLGLVFFILLPKVERANKLYLLLFLFWHLLFRMKTLEGI